MVAWFCLHPRRVQSVTYSSVLMTWLYCPAVWKPSWIQMGIICLNFCNKAWQILSEYSFHCYSHHILANASIHVKFDNLQRTSNQTQPSLGKHIPIFDIQINDQQIWSYLGGFLMTYWIIEKDINPAFKLHLQLMRLVWRVFTSHNLKHQCYIVYWTVMISTIYFWQ